MARKHFTTSMDENLLKDLKKLAIDLGCDVNTLLEDAVKQFYFAGAIKTDKAPKPTKAPKK